MGTHPIFESDFDCLTESMPLIVVCGVPCCGKTRRSVEIEKILKLKGKKVEVINDSSCGIQYSDYGNFNKEKEARGKIRSELNKHISQQTYVIIDSPNYIKGFRYELWCI